MTYSAAKFNYDEEIGLQEDEMGTGIFTDHYETLVSLHKYVCYIVSKVDV